MLKNLLKKLIIVALLFCNLSIIKSPQIIVYNKFIIMFSKYPSVI